MITSTTELRNHIAKYVKIVLDTNEPLHVTSIHGDFYIISRQQYESNKAYQMLSQEFCQEKLHESMQFALNIKNDKA